MKQNKSSNNFIMQASILAAAGIISRIIGLLYRSPLHRVIGDLGMGYYSTAYNFYTIILLVSSYSIPAAISKVIAQKLAVKEYNNAHRIFRCALAYVLVVGGCASLFLYFGAGLLVADEVIPVLRVFAPTIFVYGILGVLRGYFQAHRTMVPTSVSQILEQIANAAVSVGAAYLLIVAAFGNLDLPLTEELVVERGVKGAMGSALGTGAGVLVALLFMLLAYRINLREIKSDIASDTSGSEESYGQIIKTITLVVTPFILSTAIYNLSISVNNTIYTKVYPLYSNLDSKTIHEQWGIFAGQPVTISNIPIAFASAMAAAMIPTVAQLVAAKKIEEAREKIGMAIKSTMIISIPCAVGLFVLAKPVTHLLFTNTDAVDTQAARLLMALCISVAFYALSTLNSQILQGIGKVNAPIINAAVALVVQTAVALTLLLFTPLGLYGIVIANIVYSGLMCYLNQRSVRKAIAYRQEYRKTFGIPCLAAAGMGVIVKIVYELVKVCTKSPRIALFPAILVGAAAYFTLLLLLGGVDEQELKGFPKGYLLVRLAKKLKLLR